MTPKAQPLSPNGSGLHRLLELEAVLQQRLTTVQTEATRLVDQARDQVRAIEARSRERETEAERQLVARLDSEAAQERAALEREIAGEEARYRELTPERLDAIADQLLVSLLS